MSFFGSLHNPVSATVGTAQESAWVTINDDAGSSITIQMPFAAAKAVADVFNATLRQAAPACVPTGETSHEAA